MENLTEDQLKEIVWEDDPDYESVTGETIIDQSRWSTYFENVFLRLSDKTLWRFYWSRGSTESQDEGPEGISYAQVYEKTVMRIEYSTAKQEPLMKL